MLIPIDVHTKEMIKIADHYGIDIQTIKTVEELAELQQALCKLNIAIELGEEDREILVQLKKNLTEEIADVMIMLDQICYLYNIKYEVLFNFHKAKVDRQLKRIEEGQ